MKYLAINAISFLFAVLFLIGIYNYSIPKIEGGNKSLSTCQGKKIMVITLPIVQNASADSLLFSLDTIAAARQSNLVVIAVPSYEDGFTNSQKLQLQQWYRSKLGNYIVISNGLHTRKTSGSQQHGLFKWLTKVSLNKSFDMDVTGVNFKFFINESGDLYAVLQPHTKISSSSVNTVLNVE